MNDTTVIGGAGTADDVTDYVGAVRAWLSDLPPEEVDDLTAGMEADLAERAAESGDRLGDLLGQPEAYAAELRSAAGLPPRSAVAAGGGSRPGAFAEAAAAFRANGDRAMVRWPWLRDLRPVWWVARGVAIGGTAAAVTGSGRLLLPTIGAALSFWLGRTLAAREAGRGSGAWLPLVNVVAAFALLPVAVWLLALNTVYVDDGVPVSDTGVWVSGGMASNLYVYDAAGNRVDGARVFDSSGRPLSLDPTVVSLPDGEDTNGQVWPPDPATLSVFPLRTGDRDPWSGQDQPWAPPSAIPPLLLQPSAQPVPSASASPEPSASSSVEPTPSPSGSVAPTPTPTPTP
ncbi:HAAS signaling domain-containing protein [Oryzobacter telluris]|uniref:HAAS signaling domain-containing protein n=1 Tax=Oryzobacter telluris TaxID=3149179 RepID=UPI00370D2E63